jgi:TatD DNase family protein
MIKLVDTHAHIYLPEFDTDRDDCIIRAENLGISTLILPNIDSKSLEPLIETVKKYPKNCYPLVGLHPTHVKANYNDELEIVFSAFKKHKFFGIGEIGIDLYWDKTFFEEQKFAFEAQVNFALKEKLPVVIHARESFNEIIQCLKKINSAEFTGIFHAFTGNIQQACEVIEMGFSLGIGGVLTFKNSHLPEVIQQLDLNHIVLETDSPYLAPVPHRGKRNESAYIALIAQKIADITGTSFEQVAEITTKNACAIFKI